MEGITFDNSNLPVVRSVRGNTKKTKILSMINCNIRKVFQKKNWASHLIGQLHSQSEWSMKNYISVLYQSAFEDLPELENINLNGNFIMFLR